MAHDSIKAAREQKWTRTELKTWLTGSLKELDAFKREHKAEYEERRALAKDLGLIGPSAYGTPAPNVYKPPTKSYTPAELQLRGQFTEQYCRELFASGSSTAAKALFEADQERYQDAKDAAIAYNILPPRLSPRVRPPAPISEEWSMIISNELADESNVPRGTRINGEQLHQLCRQKVVREREASEAVEAKAAADRAAELERLSAAQRAEQTARDQKQADLDRLVELTTPKQVETPEPPQLVTTRLVEQEKAKAA